MTENDVAPSVEQRVLVWAPESADAMTIRATLQEHALHATVCESLDELCQAIPHGAGSAVIAEEALDDAALDALKAALITQPHWSDFPLVIMTRKRVAQDPDHLARILDVVGQATLLERPVRQVTLVSAVRVALRSRDRQYQLRDRIRELGETAASLRAAEHRAVSAARAKSEFFTTMSHELRTPMTAILGYAEILSESLTAPEDRRTLETIRRNGHYLLDLLNDILDLSKIEAGRLPVYKERFSPTEMIAEVCELMAVRADASGLDLQLGCDGRVPETIYSDRKRLRQVLVNVIGNAVKFTESGGIGVRCRLDTNGNDGWLEVRVDDTGIGMTQPEIVDAFQPFSRSREARIRHIPGTGLGLPISKRLIEMLGGTIDARSDPGNGSTFVIRVPTGSLEKVTLVDFDPKLGRDRERAESPDTVSQLSRHVLVVDDHRDVRDLARRYLEKVGARVTLAEDGESALKAFEASRDRERSMFDAVVLDMQMPVLDGYQTARELRNRGYRGPIMALTAAAMSGDREKCLEVGCDEHVTKPVTSRNLVETLRRLLEDERAPTGDTGKTEKRGGRTLLLVDDDPDVRLSFGMLLQNAGYDVEMVADGRSAIERAESLRPDAVLLDLGLPDISGREVASHLRNSPSLADTLLIGLTGRDDPDDLQGRFDAHLLKPASVEEVEKILGRQPLRGQP